MRETGPQDQPRRRSETSLAEEAEPNLLSRMFAKVYYGLKGSSSPSSSDSILDESDRE